LILEQSVATADTYGLNCVARNKKHLQTIRNMEVNEYDKTRILNFKQQFILTAVLGDIIPPVNATDSILRSFFSVQYSFCIIFPKKHSISYG